VEVETLRGLAHDGTEKFHGVFLSRQVRHSIGDNVFIERLWCTLKYDHIYLNSADDGLQRREDIATFLNFYIAERQLSSLSDATPDEVYHQSHINQQAA
jgi:putative transposase